MKTSQVIQILKVVAWIMFIGLCIRTGAMLVSFVVSLFVNPVAAKDIYLGLDLSALLEKGTGYYISVATLIIVLSGLKAYLFYWVIKIISTLNIAHPFSLQVERIIMKISGIALQIGILAMITNSYTKWLMKNLAHFRFEGGGPEYLFLAAILFLIAQIFKRGIELQAENELTI